MHKDEIELCIILNDWKTPSGKYKTGLNTTYLAGTKEGTPVVSGIHKGTITMPPAEIPMVCVAVGTGIAPVRALMQDRDVSRK